MDISKNDMKQEALARMVELRLHPRIISDFQEDKLNIFINETLQPLDAYQAERVRQFEEGSKCMVYHVIHNYTNFWKMLSFLYVSYNPDEWDIERRDLKARFPFAYVVNLDDEDFSEFGQVELQVTKDRMLRRIG